MDTNGGFASPRFAETLPGRLGGGASSPPRSPINSARNWNVSLDGTRQVSPRNPRGVSPRNPDRYPLEGGSRPITPPRTAGRDDGGGWPRSPVFGVLQKQVDTLEEKLNSHIADTRSQLQQERTREVVLNRMEDKVTNLESKTPDMDRRIAELMGTLTGLSDEMQAQVRRADTMETKLWEWRRKHEDDFRLGEETHEERFQQTFSNSRVIAATCEDCHKRLTQQLQNLEAELTERMAGQDQLKVGFMQLCQKVDLALEGNGPASQKSSRGNALEDTHAPAANGRDGDLATFLEVLDERIGGMTEKVDAVFKDMHEIHGKLATHAENIKSCRTTIDARESQNRVLQERLDRGDFEGKVDHLQRLAHEEAKNRTNHSDRIEAMERRVNMQEVAPDENVAKSPGSNFSANGDGRTLKTCILSSAIHECRTRIEQVEERLECLDEEFAASRDDVRIQSHVEKICEQLQLVVPKVIEHEGYINEQRAS